MHCQGKAPNTRRAEEKTRAKCLSVSPVQISFEPGQRCLDEFDAGEDVVGGNSSRPEQHAGSLNRNESGNSRLRILSSLLYGV